MGLDVGKITALLEVNDQWSNKLQHMARETSKASQVMGGDLARSARVAETAMAGAGQASNRLAAQVESTRRIHEYVAKQMVPHERAIEQQFKRTEKAADDLVKAHHRAADATVSGTTRSSGALASLGRTMVAAFAVDRIISFGAEVVKMASHVNDAAAVAGMTTTEFQRLQYAGLQSGAGVDAITRAATQLSDRLVEGKKGTVTALHDLGLSLEALRGMGPAQAIEAVGDAIQKIPRGMQQSQVATELFGSGGAEILGALNAGLTTAGDEARRLGIIINEEDIVALDNMGDAWDRVALRAKAATAGMMADLSRAFKQVTNQPDLSLKQVLQFAPKGSLGGGAFGMLVQEYLRMRMGAPDPVDLMTLNATQGRDIVLESEKKSPSFRPPPRDAATDRLIAERQRRLEALSGRDVLREATQSIADVFGKNGVGISSLGDESALRVFDKLFDAKEIAKRIEPGAVAGLSMALSTLATHPAVERSARASGAKLIASMLGPEAWQASARSIAGISGKDFLARTIGNVPGLGAPAGKGIHEIDAIKRGLDGLGVPLKTINDRFYASLKDTKDWAAAVQDVAQAFGVLAQASGGRLNPLMQILGTASGGMNAGLSLAKSFGVNGKAGAGLASGVAAASTGFSLGQGLGRAGGTIAGGVAGAASGAAIGSMISPGAGTAIGAVVGGGVGAVSGYFGARAAEGQLRKLKDLQSAELVAQYGSLNELLETVGRLGVNQESFLKRFYGEPKEFAKGVSELTTALTKERTEAERLGKALASVSAAQGLLSKEQIKQITATRNGSPGQAAVLEFAQAQRDSAESGLGRAVLALQARASLSDAEVEALTKGLDDAAKLTKGFDKVAERERILEAALKTKAEETLATFGQGAQAVAAGLFAAFSAAIESGESALDALRRLQPSIDGLMDIYTKAGKAPGGGFAQLKSYQEIATGQTGIALELASGLGQALAGFSNSALLSPELFVELATGIGQAYRQMELLGKGGLDAARLLQPSLQSIWQLAQDDPGLLAMLDDQTRALVDFATQSGLIGEKFRPAIDRMVDGLNALIAKFDEYLDRLSLATGGTLPGLPSDPTPAPSGGGEYPEGFASGTISRGSWFRNFGAGTPTVLHGTEAVVRPDQTGAFVSAFSGGAAGGRGGDRPVVLKLRDNRILAEVVAQELDGILTRRGVRR